MANTSKISGFRPSSSAIGGAFQGQGHVYAVLASDSTALFVGDPVKLDGAGHTNGMASVTKATAGASVLGVVVGILPAKMDPVSGSMTAGSITLDTPVYRPASTFQYVLVNDDPGQIYEVEAVTGSNALYAFAVADIGLNADLATVAGSTTTGASAAALDMATKATTATLQWKILGTVNRVDNEPTGNSTKVLVKINNAILSGGTGATGV
jgi:hypothetical protein